MSFFGELRRRNVLRVAVLYLVAAWLVLQVADVSISLLELPSGTGRLVFILLALGFPLALLFSWYYELTPDGLKTEREIDRSASITEVTGKRLTILTAALFGLALLTVALNQWVGSRFDAAPTTAGPSVAAEPAEAGSPPEFSIAVLPFRDRSETGDQVYLAEGLAEDILNLLAQVPDLHVIARTSSFSFRESSADVGAIAQALNVAHVLEGSVRPGPERVRVTAQLIQTTTGFPLWSEHFERAAGDLYAIQSEVAAAVVVSLMQSMASTPSSGRIDPEAYRLTLQARYLSSERKFDAASLDQAEGLLKAALELEPRYVDALLELGRIHGTRGRRMLVPQDEAFAEERRYFEQALEVDPESTHALASVAWSDLMSSDYASAAERLERLLARDPQSMDGLVTASVLLKFLGRHDEAVAVERYLASRDPVAGGRHHNLGLTLMTLGRPWEAESSFRKVLSLRPSDPWAHFFIGESLLLQGAAEAALAEFELANTDYRLLGRAMALHDLGRQAESDAAVAELVALVEEREPSLVAFAHAYRGAADAAFEWFEKEYELSGNGAWYGEWKSNALLAGLRDDPRWAAMFERAGLSDRALEAIEFRFTPPNPPGRLLQAAR